MSLDQRRIPKRPLASRAAADRAGPPLVGGLVPVHLSFVLLNVLLRDLIRVTQCVDAGLT